MGIWKHPPRNEEALQWPAQRIELKKTRTSAFPPSPAAEESNRSRPEVGFLGEGNPVIQYQRVVVDGLHNGLGLWQGETPAEPHRTSGRRNRLGSSLARSTAP